MNKLVDNKEDLDTYRYYIKNILDDINAGSSWFRKITERDILSKLGYQFVYNTDIKEHELVKY